MVLNGFNQEGGKVTGNIGKVEVISRQNTSTTTGSSSGISLGISANGVPSSVNINGSRTNGDRAFVDNQSTFIVGDGSSLHVGTLENTAAVVGKQGNSTFKIDNYIGKDIQNHDTMKTTGGSVGISTGKPRITNVGFNQDSRDKQGITRNTVVGDVEIAGAEGSPINRDITRANEVTKDTHSSTNINVESQTIEYATNPAKLKEDIGKAKDEINDIKWAIDKSIHDMGDDNRNFFGQLSEVRLNKTIDNITSQRLIGKTADTEIAGIFKDAYKDLGYDIEIIFSDPKNSPQLLDENDKPKTGTAYVRDENGKKIKTIIINGKVEGRQRKTGTDKKGLESTRRASNEYFAEKYKNDNTPISIHSDGKDYSNVDFGENVGDKEIVSQKWWDEKRFVTKKEKDNVINSFIESYHKKNLSPKEKLDLQEYYKKKIDWEEYSKNFIYRREINYYYNVSLNSVKSIDEFKRNRNQFEEVSKAESVFHNIYGNKIKITGNLNRKFVNYENGKEVVLNDKLTKIVNDPINRGTFNYYSYKSKNWLEAIITSPYKAMHLIDIHNWVSFGTGIDDRHDYAAVKQRGEMLKLGAEISSDYTNIESWAESKKIQYVGREELNQYYKFRSSKTGDEIRKFYEDRLRKAGIIK